MRLEAFICAAGFACAAALAASPAVAEPPPWALSSRPFLIPPVEAVAIVRSSGFIPVSPPTRIGTSYTVSAVDPYGTPVRVIVDARQGYVLGVRRVGARAPAAPLAGVPGIERPSLLGPVPRDIYADDDNERPLRPRAIPDRSPRPEASEHDPRRRAAAPETSDPSRRGHSAPALPLESRGGAVTPHPAHDGSVAGTAHGGSVKSGASGSPAAADGDATVTQSVRRRLPTDDAAGAFPPVTPLQ